MDIAFMGRSAFRIRGKDATIVTDPYPPGRGPGMGKIQADVITVSHDSADHMFVTGVDGGARVVSGPGEYEVGGILLHGVATHTEPKVGPSNTAYVFRVDDVILCHLGAIQAKLTDEQLEEIGAVDVVMVPVGANGTLNPAAAAEVVAQLEPSVVIPMEYREGGVSENQEPVERFTREMGAKQAVPEAKLSVTKNTLPSEMRVVVLEARRG